MLKYSFEKFEFSDKNNAKLAIVATTMMYPQLEVENNVGDCREGERQLNNWLASLPDKPKMTNR